MSDSKKPVDMVMLHPDGETEVHVAAVLVDDCKARGFKPVCTVAEAEKKAKKAEKPAE